MRLPWPAVVGGTLIAVLGAAGLVRAAVPQSPAGGGSSIGASTAGPIAITGAYVQAPVPPSTTAAAYFTVYNTTAKADRLLSVVTGAGPTAVLHAETASGAMAAVGADGVVIPAHGTLKLSVGKGHVMIEHVYGTLKAGQSVNISASFQNAGTVNVVAPVVGLGQSPPGGAAAPSTPSSSSPSGAHS
jgi:periplasmic copper chaperone A